MWALCDTPCSKCNTVVNAGMALRGRALASMSAYARSAQREEGAITTLRRCCRGPRWIGRCSLPAGRTSEAVRKSGLPPVALKGGRRGFQPVADVHLAAAAQRVEAASGNVPGAPLALCA
jgi:hypothetical protein